MTAERMEGGSPPDLRQAWGLARLELLAGGLDHEPDEVEIAEHLSRSPSLRYIAGLHHAPVSPKRIIELRVAAVHESENPT
jgi:hypothetical protein